MRMAKSSASWPTTASDFGPRRPCFGSAIARYTPPLVSRNAGPSATIARSFFNKRRPEKGRRSQASLSPAEDMPMIAQVGHHPCCSQVEKRCGWLPSPRRSTRRRFRAAVTTHIALSWKKLWGFAWRPRRARGERSHMPLSFIASWLPSFLSRPRQQVYPANHSNMPQPSSHG